VNFSSKLLGQADLAAYVSQTLAETELAPQSLWVELTESGLIENLEQAADMLQELKELGVSLSLDDFGTG